ncbi:MAG TPA: zinc metallopeptidase [Candidatus Sumerlaeota bacterium]|nr:MAG: putative neutral zinc metallopeptidase [candidate division BRC1 bacterium ADurb.BinA292]HOE96046.1 zinc metallopeptidase [Candidatus Sumerlaeota bacterium]HOR28889.1 zinc metallopeptidase [Candidatus Sumerlaeota bacterium]HPK02073.1 zinc metallopeptidase [Candidatus Sumerlaeota bacterium]
MFFDPGYLLFVFLPTLILAGGASLWVKSAFSKYSKVRASSGLTGAQAARAMLRAAGMDRHVSIERVSGHLSDHYDPRHKVLRLSPAVHDQASLAAVGVACHEVGHALQDAQAYKPLVLRNAIVPTAGFGSNFGMILVMIGLGISTLTQSALGFYIAMGGVLLFGTVVVFQLVNLPVEFNASARAKQMVVQLGIVQPGREAGAVASVLNAAAMTYVAATVTAILQMLYFLMLVMGRRN